jgi:8-oxo-dGTP diphosphatase
VAILAVANSGLEVLLIRWANKPFRGRWAHPGGFLEMDEDLATCAARELEEETGIRGLQLQQLHAFGAVDRHPRDRVVCVAFYCLLAGGRLDGVEAGDDAAAADWFSVDALPEPAFDPRDIIQLAVRRSECN